MIKKVNNKHMIKKPEKKYLIILQLTTKAVQLNTLKKETYKQISYQFTNKN